MEKDRIKTKGLDIKTRLILSILPIVVIMLIVLTTITSTINKNVIVGLYDKEMQATLGEYTNDISADLTNIKAEAETASALIGATYGHADIDVYKKALSEIVRSNPMILGSGLWFEPNKFDKNEYYYGPYWYKNMDGTKWDGKDLIETWDYSNAEYDYFSQEYYLISKTYTNAIITEPYYDEESGLVMASCTCPILSSSYEFLGCITMDIMLTNVQSKVSTIKVGDTGTVWLIDGNGNYIYHPAIENAASKGINVSTSIEMGENVKHIQEDKEGMGEFEYDGQTRLLYFSTIPSSTWKMGLTITQKELFNSIYKAMNISVTMCVVIIILCAIMIIREAKGISKATNQIAKALTALSIGKFEKIELKDGEKPRKDEFGIMVDSTNQVIDKLNEIVGSIKTLANDVTNSSKELATTSSQISQTADGVSDAVGEIATGATEQAEEIQTASEASGTVGDAVNTIINTVEIIKNSSDEMINSSKDSAESLNELNASSEATSKHIKNIEDTINATRLAVETISERVEGIQNIAKQTNLLSLNASIEAARVGEAGKGFAVVAGEIGKLAASSKDLADEIKKEMEALLSKTDEAVEASIEVKNSNDETQVALNETKCSIEDMIVDINKTVENIVAIESQTKDCDNAKNTVIDMLSSLSAISEENAAASEETEASMDELKQTVSTLAESAEILSEIANKLEEEMKFFDI